MSNNNIIDYSFGNNISNFCSTSIYGCTIRDNSISISICTYCINILMVV